MYSRLVGITKIGIIMYLRTTTTVYTPEMDIQMIAEEEEEEDVDLSGHTLWYGGTRGGIVLLFQFVWLSGEYVNIIDLPAQATYMGESHRETQNNMQNEPTAQLFTICVTSYSWE